jgi:tetratricopeptide (TPR) repeat protein
MAGMTMRRALLLALIVLGCRGSISEETIRHHPRIELVSLVPAVIESSGPIRPAWIEKSERGAVAFVPFAGQAMAPTLEAAKAQAERDLYASVSSFISVDVSSSFESKESFTAKNGQETSKIDVSEVLRSRTSAQLKEVKVDELYWERVQTSPLLPDSTQYRYFTYARVPKAEILRARLQKQATRQQGSGRRVLVVLPFRGPVESAAIQDGMVEDLARRLSTVSSIVVSDPELVRSLLAGDRGASEAAALETIGDALMPDFVVAGSWQIHAGRVRVTWSLRGPSGVLDGGVVEDKVESLYAIEDKLLDVLITRIGATKAELGAPVDRPKGSAVEAYAEAGALYRAGKNEEAIASLGRALGEDPGYGRAYLRLGRVLERMGRYGDREPWSVDPPPQLELCLAWKRITAEDPKRWLAALAGPAPPPPPMLGERIGEVLSAAQYGIDEGYVPKPEVATIPASAVGAYWHAYRLSAEDPILRNEASIALGDLALRVDQLEAGAELYQRALKDTGSRGQHHLELLAMLGLGKVAKEQGDLEAAARQFQEVLRRRRSLGEKPYVLEVLNELGGVAVELGQHPIARAVYEEALRIAEDLDDAYLIAILGNNLGVLEATLGQTVRAEERFQRALGKLTDLGEADGRIAAGLNVGLVAARQGDLVAAVQRYRDAGKIIDETGQRAREAQVLLHQGHAANLAGDTEGALKALIRSWALYDRLGRHRDRLRVENELVVLGLADLGRRNLHAQERAQQLACLAARADQISNEWGWQRTTTGLAPFAAWSNAMWLRSMADGDGYFAWEYERYAYNGRRRRGRR